MILRLIARALRLVSREPKPIAITVSDQTHLLYPGDGIEGRAQDGSKISVVRLVEDVTKNVAASLEVSTYSKPRKRTR